MTWAAARFRFPIELVGAVVVTMALYASLHALIAQRSATGIELPAPIKIEFRPLRVETEIERRPVVVKPERPELRPPPPRVDVSPGTPDPKGAGSVSIDDVIRAITPPIGPGQAADRGPGPLVRTEPEYPMQARQRGLEGWVLVEFTVSTAGTVKDAGVVASEPGTVFDGAAVNAVRKWKYSPKLQGGRAVEQPMKVRLDFEMEK
jgi:protein TonB